MSKEKKLFQMKVVLLLGLVTSVGLIAFGLSSKMDSDEAEEKVVISTPVIIPKKLTEAEQMQTENFVKLAEGVSNRFEDETSKERALLNSRNLLKEYILEKQKEALGLGGKEIKNWGDFLAETKRSEVDAWNELKKEEYSKELIELKQKNDVISETVEEISQNNPMYIWQEKKIIQRELYELWADMVKNNVDELEIITVTDETLTNGTVDNKSADKQNSALNEVAVVKVIPERIPETNDIKKISENNLTNNSEVKREVVEENKLIKESEEKFKKEKEQAELNYKKIQEELEKAVLLSKELEKKGEDLSVELKKHDENLKNIEVEISKTRDELKKLDTELLNLKNQDIEKELIKEGVIKEIKDEKPKGK